jgi:cytochrome c biogenesis protein CcdA
VNLLGLSLAAGALTTLSPCVFPLLPLVVGGGLQRHRAAPLAMGAGLVASFAAAGLLVGTLGDAFGLDGDLLRQAGAVLLVVFGGAMAVPALEAALARLATPLASSAGRVAAAWRSDTLPGAFAIGALLGLVWSPCAGPLLGATLGLLADAGGAARGGLLLATFGLGAALPLVAAGYASRAGFARARGRVLRHAALGRRIFGALLIASGLASLTGVDRWLEARVTAWLPAAWIALTTRW